MRFEYLDISGPHWSWSTWHTTDSDTMKLSRSLCHSVWHALSDNMTLTLTDSLADTLSNTFSPTRSLQHVPSDMISVSQSLWHTVWHALSDMISVTWSVWHDLSDMLSLTLWLTETQRQSDKKQSLWHCKGTCLRFTPPSWDPHLSVYMFTTVLRLVNCQVREMVLKPGMSLDIWYYCNWVAIPERTTFSININRTLLQSAYKSVHFFHVHNELKELVGDFGIGVRYNKS